MRRVSATQVLARSVDRLRRIEQHTLALVGVLALALFARAYIYRSVFQERAIVLLSNDPYRVRYHVETVAKRAGSPFDVAAFADPAQYDLAVAVLGWFVEVLGGGPPASGFVLAWYPVVAALLMCVLVYVIGTSLSGSQWIGVLAAGFVAMMPTHVSKTALGFGDHHAFDYLLLSMTVAGVVMLVVARREGTADRVWPRDRRTWAAVGLLALGAAGQVLAWKGGIILLGPLPAGVAVVTLVALSRGQSPLSEFGPVALGLVLAVGLVVVGHLGMRWQSFDIEAVGVVLLVGGVAVVLLGEGVYRTGVPRPAVVFGGALLVAGASVAGISWFSSPVISGVVTEGVDYFRAHDTSGIAETVSMFGGPNGVVTGPLSFFGLVLFFALPFLVAVTALGIRERRGDWLLLATYAWAFLALGHVQRRFAIGVALFLAPIAAAAFVELAGRVGVVADQPLLGDGGGSPGVSFRESAGVTATSAVALLGILLLAASFAQIPPIMESKTIDQSRVDTALWMAEYAEEEGLGPEEDYVFSPWDSNLMYNYFVSGEARSYAYAKGNYRSFAASDDGYLWQQRLDERGTGFVVVHGTRVLQDGEYLAAKLTRLGSSRGGDSGTGYFRALYRSSDEAVTAYSPVQGALIGGQIAPNRSVSVTSDVSLPSSKSNRTGTTFRYTRQIESTIDGTYGLLVPYPGTYSITLEEQEKDVSVSEDDVIEGKTIGERNGTAHWSFNEGQGRLVLDSVSNHHWRLRQSRWTDGVSGSALGFDGGDPATVRSADSLGSPSSLTVSLWVRTRADIDYPENMQWPRLVAMGNTSRFPTTNGFQIAMAKGQLLGAVGDSNSAAVIHCPRIDDGDWHNAVLTWNGSVVEVSLDGTSCGRGSFTGEFTGEGPLAIGAAAEGNYGFAGSIDEVRIRDRASTAKEIKDEYNETDTST